MSRVRVDAGDRGGVVTAELAALRELERAVSRAIDAESPAGGHCESCADDDCDGTTAGPCVLCLALDDLAEPLADVQRARDLDALARRDAP